MLHRPDPERMRPDGLTHREFMEDLSRRATEEAAEVRRALAEAPQRPGRNQYRRVATPGSVVTIRA